MLSASQPARNFTAPCVSMISVWKLRPLRGMSSTKMRSIKVLTVPDWAHNSELGRDIVWSSDAALAVSTPSSFDPHHVRADDYQLPHAELKSGAVDSQSGCGAVWS